MARPRNPNPTDLPLDHGEDDDSIPEASVYDLSNPKSVINLSPPQLRASIGAIDPRLLLMTEADLRKAVRPDHTLCSLRFAFWDEFYRVLEVLPKRPTAKINVSRIARGVCTREFFYSVVASDPKKLVWVVTQPMDHMLQQREILEALTAKLRDVTKLKVFVKEEKERKDGTIKVVRRPDYKAISAIMQAYEKLCDRVYGGQIQRVAHVHKALPGGASGLSPNLLDAGSPQDVTLEALEKIESQLAELAGQRSPKEVDVIEAEEEQ